MRFLKTKLNGICLIEPLVHEDSRGFFFESYSQRDFEANGIQEHFVQDNISRSRKGTWRGLHYQLPPHQQGKLVRVMEGEVFDVVVDIRRGSPTFGQWFGTPLSAENKRALYVPPGFAHGFCVVSEVALLTYKCTALYSPLAERAIRWNDPKIGIKLPLEPDPALISPKDKNAPSLDEAEISPFF
ncbi:MAG TPA: dTDP-4-dehydrorhamnose 3,5-epimerase [Elusimicrobiota bacterium]|nr:dTDP-4-dehydrorhamnose 3,5-epimerase [Elusimicrobiota bacterium]